MKQLYYYVIILFLWMGCTQSNTVQTPGTPVGTNSMRPNNIPSNTEQILESNKTITDVFDKSEINELAVIVDFFNAQICAAQKEEKATLTQCYQHFFEMIKECEISGSFDSIPFYIPYPEQQNLYSQLSEDVFDQIWRIEHRWFYSSQDSVEIISITYKGKYLKFLKEFGKENGLIEEYADDFEQMGDIAPTCFSMVMNEYQRFDVNDIRMQLFLAMHYLTLNDTFEGSKKYKPNTSYMNDRLETLPKSAKVLKER